MLHLALALLAGLPPLAVARYDGHDCVAVAVDDVFADGCDVKSVDGAGALGVVCGDKRDTVFVAADLCASKRSDTELTPAQRMYVSCLKGVVGDGVATDAAGRARLTQKLQICACQSGPLAALLQERAGPDAMARVAVDCKRAAADDGPVVGVVVSAGVAVVVVAVVVMKKKKKKKKQKTQA